MSARLASRCLSRVVTSLALLLALETQILAAPPSGDTAAAVQGSHATTEGPGPAVASGADAGAMGPVSAYREMSPARMRSKSRAFLAVGIPLASVGGALFSVGAVTIATFDQRIRNDVYIDSYDLLVTIPAGVFAFAGGIALMSVGFSMIGKSAGLRADARDAESAARWHRELPAFSGFQLPASQVVLVDGRVLAIRF